MRRFIAIFHTADIAYEIFGCSREDLFLSGHAAWLDATIHPPEMNNAERKMLKFYAADLETLLVEFLSEINYLLLQKKWLAQRVKVTELNFRGAQYELMAEVLGYRAEIGLLKIKNEIKAVTYHQLDIKQTGDIYHSKLIFDT